MKRFLRILRGEADERPVVSWQRMLSPHVVTTLVAEGILEPAPNATTWTCDGGGLEGCPRRIVPGTAEEGTPYMALCGGGECDDKPLGHADVTQLAVAFDRFVDALRDRLAVIGRGVLAKEIFPSTFAIGAVERAGKTVDVCLALHASNKVFPHFLASRNHRDTIVLVSNPYRVPDELLALHGPGARVELVLLEDVLKIESGHLAAGSGWMRGLQPTEAAVESAATVRLYTEAGQQLLTPAEADAWAQREADLDFFLDGVHGVSGRRGTLFRVSTRQPDGRRHEGRVAHSGAAALVTLVARRTPMHTREIPALNGKEDAARIVERARKAAEGEAPWRWILTRRGALPGDNTFEFAPPVQGRFAVLVPMAGIAAPPKRVAARK